MTLNIPELTAAWTRLDALAPGALAPITSEEAYSRALETLEALLAEVGEDAAHPLGALLRGLIERVTAYQDVAGHVPPAAPDLELRLLMRERGLTQVELARETGIDQAQISRLASGKRAFTVEHILALSRAFGVSPSVFLGGTPTG